MTDRDEFAKAAMNGFVSSMGAGKPYDLDLVAKHSYEIADAMLRVKNKNGVTPNCTGEPDIDSRVWETPARGSKITLTALEREAINEAIQAFGEFSGDEIYAASLRALLARTGDQT